MKSNKQNLRDLWDTTKHTNICIMKVSEGEEKERHYNFEEIIVKSPQM